MDPALIAEVERITGVSNVRPLVPGGQKHVARAELSGREVVIKVIELSGPHADVILERARREVDLLQRIDHPNVVRVLTGLLQVGGPSLVAVAWLEEFLDGEDLRARIGALWTWSEARAMGLDVARGLEAMHTRRVVHRDLSPGNIRCTSSGSYVIMDPGVARHIEESTLTGLFQPGTPGHMSPEHASLTRPTPASDVFALGILLYQVLSGSLPFPVGKDFDAYRVALRDDQAPSIGTVRKDLSPPQVAFVDRCLHRQSARRYLDGSELGAALEQL